MSILTELKRRNVFRTAIAYAVVAWLLMQVGDTLAPALRLPEWTTSLLAFFLLLGFPLAIFFAWTYEMTPEGLRPERGERDRTDTPHAGRGALNIVIIVGLSLALGYFVYDKYFHAAGDASPAGQDAIPVEHTRRSVAVLPFANLSSDRDQEYFADGLTEEIINLLAKVPRLPVTSRTSAFYYKDKDVRIADVAQDLGVTHVIEGSVRRAGNQVRVTAQLIRADDDVHLWSETWDRQLENVFAIQDEIAAAVTTALEIQLVDELPHAYVTSAGDYVLYLKALDQFNTSSVESLVEAKRLLESLLDSDPGYGPALILLGKTELALGGWGPVDPEEALASAERLGTRAVEAAPELSGGYYILGRVAALSGPDWRKARRFTEQAVATDPTNLEARLHLAFLKTVDGETEPYLQAALEITRRDPLSASGFRSLGYALKFSDRYDESADAFRKSMSLNPDHVAIHASLAEALFLAGHYQEALEVFAAEPLKGFTLYGNAMVYHELGDAGKSDAALQELLEINAGDDYWAAQIAMVHAVRNEKDEALRWLYRALELRDPGLQVSGVNPFLDKLRGDPEFEEFMDAWRSGGRAAP